jgi:hypothetical protein
MFAHERDLSEIREQVSWLNSLDSVYSPWKETDARKQHVDEFNDIINAGDVYFNKQVGVAWDAVFKLSLKSMCTLLDCIFYMNGLLSTACKEKYEKIIDIE